MPAKRTDLGGSKSSVSFFSTANRYRRGAWTKMETWKVNAMGTAHAFDPGERSAVCVRMRLSDVKARRELRRCVDCRVIVHNRAAGPTVLVRTLGGVAERPRV